MRNAFLISNGLGRPASFYALLRGIRALPGDTVGTVGEFADGIGSYLQRDSRRLRSIADSEGWRPSATIGQSRSRSKAVGQPTWSSRCGPSNCQKADATNTQRPRSPADLRRGSGAGP